MNKTALYAALLQQARALTETRFGPVTNAANLAALLYQNLPDINWAGFYFLDGDMLRAGAFSGQARLRGNPLGQGVYAARPS